MKVWFDRFDQAISLNQTQRERAESAIRGLEQVLRSADSGVLGAVERIEAQGSFARGTIVKPVEDHHSFDVDVLAIGSWQDPASYWGSQMAAKSSLKKLAVELRRHHNYAGKVHLKERCVRVEFADRFHLDIVPARPTTQGHAIPDKSRDEWVATHPHGLTNWYQRQESGHRGRFSRIARFVREWKRNIYSKRGPTGMILDILVAEAMPSYQQFAGDAQVLAGTFERMPQVLERFAPPFYSTTPAIPNPSLPDENLGRKWTDGTFESFGGHCRAAARAAAVAASQRDTERARMLWQDLLGPRFP